MSNVIESTDLKIYLSGGAANEDPNDSLGGIISATELVDNNLHNLFAKVSAAEALAGSTKYRGVYIKNENGHTLTLESAVAFIESQTTSGDTSIEIAVANEAIDAEMATIADEDTAPASISGSWVSAVGEASGSAIGNVADDSFRGIWIKRIVTASASAYGNDTAEFGVSGETTST
jgi:hypothetical protein